MSELINEYYELLGMVREYIHYQKFLGVEYIPVSTAADLPYSETSAVDLEETLAHELHHIDDIGIKRQPGKSADREKGIASLRGEMNECTKCKLAKTRTKLVFGEGSLNASLVFVGEAPGRDEDMSGRPFVGRAGQLLTKIIQAMGMEREDVYIMNIVKCRPPENRNPQDDEIKTCEPFMLRQLGLISPEIICTLGAFSTQTLLKTVTPISRLRGNFHDYHGIKLMPTFHPAFLLRNAGKKKEVWEDMQKIMHELGIK